MDIQREAIERVIAELEVLQKENCELGYFHVANAYEYVSDKLKEVLADAHRNTGQTRSGGTDDTAKQV